MEFVHIPVMLDEVIEGLNIKENGIYVDCTVGGGGHSFEIAKRLGSGHLYAFDRDAEAIQKSTKTLAPFSEKVTIIKSNFKDSPSILRDMGVEKIDGFLIDLGVSSHQIDEGERGFSFVHDGPLDMRMDRSDNSLTARDIVNNFSYEDLMKIFYSYGEEEFSKNIAKKIVEQREKKPIETTLELVDIIKSAMPGKAKREKQHPAKRSFQAIRIAVNDELGAVREAMDKAIDCLNPGGRLAVITFHSLEDRIVKAAFQQAAQGCTCPKEFPVCVCGKKPKVRLTTRKPILPDEREIGENPRARSAKLRVCEKI